MKKLKGFQRRYLKGMAHGLKPVVFIGHKGITESVARSIHMALDRHELIKVKFVDFKEKERKAEIAASLEKDSGSEMVGMIGHMAIYYRQQNDPEKRRITIPERDI